MYSELSSQSPWKLDEATAVKLKRSWGSIVANGFGGPLGWFMGSVWTNRFDPWPVYFLVWLAFVIVWFFVSGGFGYFSVSRWRWRLAIKKVKQQPASQHYSLLATERQQQLRSHTTNLSLIADLEKEMCAWWKIAEGQAKALNKRSAITLVPGENDEESARQLLKQSEKARKDHERAVEEAKNLTSTG